MADRLPLYKSLANALEQHIYNGDWPVGSVLPAEADLCKSFHSSRHTLRHALQILESNGLIFRRQGAPTQVVSRQRLRRFTQSFNSPIDILSYSRDTYRINLVEEFIELDKPLSQIVGAPAGSSWYHIGGMRKRQQSEDVIAWTDIYILPQFASLTKDPEHTQVMVYEQIEKKYSNYEVSTIDGVKIQFDKDWVHLRRSNTEPIIRIYAESNSETTSDNIANQIMKDLQNNDATVPYAIAASLVAARALAYSGRKLEVACRDYEKEMGLF